MMIARNTTIPNDLVVSTERRARPPGGGGCTARWGFKCKIESGGGGMVDNAQEFIYAIAHPHNYVKFGRSKDPRKRLQSVQIGSPYELWLLATLPVDNAERVEQELHDHLGHKKVRGEWFKLSYDDYDMIVDMVKMAGSEHDFASIDDFKAWQQRKREAMR